MRIGEVPEQLLDQIMEPIVGMDETEGLGGPYHYRNKAQISESGQDKDDNGCDWRFMRAELIPLFLIRIARLVWMLMSGF